MQNNRMKARIIMVTGGQRSGKSLFAEKLALKLSDHPTYLATARVLDQEMERRVTLHGNGATTHGEISKHLCLQTDCLSKKTKWCS